MYMHTKHALQYADVSFVYADLHAKRNLSPEKPNL